jgi:hypothetical protein
MAEPTSELQEGLERLERVEGRLRRLLWVTQVLLAITGGTVSGAIYLWLTGTRPIVASTVAAKEFLLVDPCRPRVPSKLDKLTSKLTAAGERADDARIQAYPPGPFLWWQTFATCASVCGPFSQCAKVLRGIPVCRAVFAALPLLAASTASTARAAAFSPLLGRAGCQRSLRGTENLGDTEPPRAFHVRHATEQP